MTPIFNWTKPDGKKLEKAEAFFWNKHTYSAMVGGIRNAKTTAACRRGIYLSLAFPGNRGLIARYENTNLQKTTLLIFKEELSKLNNGKWSVGPVIKRINENENFVVLQNDSVIYWAHLDTPEDVQGSEWGWVYIDELHEIKEDTFNQLKARMTFWNKMRVAEFIANKHKRRMQREFLGVSVKPQAYFFVTQNPNPNWTKKRIKENVHQEFFVIESTTEENKENLPDGWYEEQIRTMPKEWVDRFLMNSWDIAGGQIYKEFSTSVHAIDEFKIPQTWERLSGMDFGLRHPTTYYWLAIDTEGNIFIYDEHYQSNMLPDAHARVIHAKSDAMAPEGGVSPCSHYLSDGRKYYRAIADPSGKNRAIVSGAKLFDEYLEQGIACEAGNNDFALGYTRVSQYLHVDPEHYHPLTGKLGSPRLFVMRNCPNAIREFIEYSWENVPSSENRAESEKPKKVNDDAMDAIRYVIVTRPEPTKLTKRPEPLDRFRQMAVNAFTQEEREEDEVWN